MSRAILFDLDGTLLHCNFEREREYFRSVLPKEDANKFIETFIYHLYDYEEMFLQYDIKKLSLPYVKKLDEASFFGCFIEELHLGENLRVVANEAFMEANIDRIYVPNQKIYNLVKRSYYDFNKVDNTQIIIV